MTYLAKVFRGFFGLMWLAWCIQIVKAAQMAASPMVYSPGVADQWANTAEHLTLSGTLIIAVTMLWRELGKKDNLLIQSTATVTAALGSTTAANIELRTIVNHSIEAHKQLTDAITSLAERIERLPCTESLKRKT